MKVTLSRTLLVLAGMAVCSPLAAQNYYGGAAPIRRASHSSLIYSEDAVPPPPGTAVDVDPLGIDSVPSPAADMAMEAMPCDSPSYASSDYPSGKSMLSDCCSEPCIKFEVGGMYLHRGNTDNQVLLTNPAAANAVVLQSNDADLDWAGGIELRLEAQLDECTSIEMRYFSVTDWTGATAIADTGVRYETPFTAPGITYGAGQFRYDSQLSSFEANIRNNNCGWTWLYGFRHINLSENAFFQVTNPNAEVTVDIENHLYGFQVGGDGTVMSGNCFTVDIWGKAGIYYNDNQQVRLTSGDFGNTVVTRGDDSVAFVGEAGIRGEYMINCHWSLYGGYQVMLLGMGGDGVALAPNQLGALAGGPAANSNNDVFYHGAMFGIQMRR